MVVIPDLICKRLIQVCIGLHFVAASCGFLLHVLLVFSTIYEISHFGTLDAQNCASGRFGIRARPSETYWSPR